MLSIKYFLIYNLFLLLLASCCSKEYFEEEDLLWLEPYKENDLLIFRSNLQKYDTLEITKKEIVEPSGKCNWLEVANFSSETASIDYRFKRGRFWEEEQNLLYLDKRPKGATTSPVIRVFNLEFYETDRALKKESTYLKFLNKAVTDSFVFSIRNTEMLYPDFGIRKFYWTKKLGLIKYQNNKGETWELFKHIRKKV